MTANELRELAQKIEEKWWRWKDNPTIELKAADYLRACADALDAGPVAWRKSRTFRIRRVTLLPGGEIKPSCYVRRWVPCGRDLYDEKGGNDGHK